MNEITEATENVEVEEIFGSEGSVELPIMPLRNTVLFPQQVIPIYIGRERSLNLIENLPKDNRYIGVVAQEEGSVEEPNPPDAGD